MKLKLSALAILLSAATIAMAQDSLTIRKIYDEALVNGKSYENLRYLCKNIGARLSGSPNAQRQLNGAKS